MATIQKKKNEGGLKVTKRRQQKRQRQVTVKASSGFEKAWEFWKTAHVDLSNFKFDRDEANAR